MAMSTGGGSSSVQSSPNVTPMIDVMLVLLIIFMVVTPALLEGFAAEPPKAQNLKDHPEDPEMDQVLGLDRDGNYYLNKKPYRSADDVAIALDNIYSNRDDYVLYLKAHKDLEYSKVLDAMDMAAKHKVKVVGLISEQKPGTISTVEGDSRAQQAVPGGNP